MAKKPSRRSYKKPTVSGAHDQVSTQEQQIKQNRFIQLRWSSLVLVAVIAFIVLTNTQSHTPPAQAKPGKEKTEHHELAQAAEIALGQQPARQNKQTHRQQLAVVQPADTIHQIAKKISIPAIAPATPRQEKPPLQGEIKTWVVRSGDTWSGILDHFNIHSALSDILASPGHKPVLKLLPGKTIELLIEQKRLMAITYHKSKTNYLSLTRQDNNRFKVEEHRLKTESRPAYAFGIVESTFYAAAVEAGLSDRTIINIANILAWDIDFILNIRKHDYFSVIYEEKYLHGEKIADGHILGVDFYNNGTIYRAIRYTPTNGRTDYYAPDGRMMRKAFLRSPLQFTRITSGFNPARLHPVYKTIRPHRGVDYGAATGTPVYASGDGKIIFRGKKPGYGNVVIIRHAGIYSTLYAHLSKFASRQSVGSPVRQKQVIGYVGMTGVATGPHLHYEFRVHGVHKDPLQIKLPAAKPLPDREMPRFTKTIAGIQKQLQLLNKVVLVDRHVTQ